MEAYDPNTQSNALSIPALPPQRAASPVWAFALDAVIAVAIMLAVSMAYGFLWSIWLGFEQGRRGVPLDPAMFEQGPGALSLLLMTLLGMSGAAATVYFLRRRASAQERALSWQAARKPSTWGWVLLTLAVVMCTSMGTTTLATWLDSRFVPSNLAIMQDIQERMPWLLWVFAVVLAPLYEEVLFRRVLFGRLWAAGRPVLGALLSSVLFALAHEFPGMGNNSPAAAALLWTYYVFMGLALAWVYRRTGTLWAPIGVHALNNLAACIMIALGIG